MGICGFCGLCLLFANLAVEETKSGVKSGRSLEIRQLDRNGCHAGVGQNHAGPRRHEETRAPLARTLGWPWGELTAYSSKGEGEACEAERAGHGRGWGETNDTFDTMAARQLPSREESGLFARMEGRRRADVTPEKDHLWCRGLREGWKLAGAPLSTLEHPEAPCPPLLARLDKAIVSSCRGHRSAALPSRQAGGTLKRGPVRKSRLRVCDKFQRW